MIINTKFDVGQNVWIMYLNKPIEVTLTSISTRNWSIYINGNKNTRANILYAASDIKNSRSWNDHDNIPESIVATTKEELLTLVFRRCEDE